MGWMSWMRSGAVQTGTNDRPLQNVTIIRAVMV